VAVPLRLAEQLVGGHRRERLIEPAVERLEVGALFDLAAMERRGRQTALGQDLQHRLGLGSGLHLVIRAPFGSVQEVPDNIGHRFEFLSECSAQRVSHCHRV
jgi:hypothetical protein